MSGRQEVIDAAEANIRMDTGIVWDTHIGSAPSFSTPGAPEPPARATGDSMLTLRLDADLARRARDVAADYPPRTDGAAYAHDGSMEGLLTAVYLAIRARDTAADICEASMMQARLGQETVHVHTDIASAMRLRRSLEMAQGRSAFHCVRAACASEDPDKGTIVLRFVAHALATSDNRRCWQCPRKGICTQSCMAPPRTHILDDISVQPVSDLAALYRSVVNERHHMIQFIRFEHREGDVWYARCHPKANVVPLLMDWFVARFNDQRFVIHDERHAVSGVYDSSQWYLVGGDAVTPPPVTADEGEMRRAWQQFYRNASIDMRYHPEIRRNFMPMRLWRDLPELQQHPDYFPAASCG